MSISVHSNAVFYGTVMGMVLNTQEFGGDGIFFPLSSQELDFVISVASKGSEPQLLSSPFEI